MQAQSKRPPRSLAEWVTFGIASAILSAVAGLVVFSWVTKQYSPVQLELQQKEIRQTNGQFYVPFEVKNEGGETVEAVQIVAELQIGDRTETGDQQIDFLSEGETEEGGFIFRQDPRRGKLTVRVASYKTP